MRIFVGSLFVFVLLVLVGSSERILALPQGTAAALTFETASIKASLRNTRPSAGCHSVDVDGPSNTAIPQGQCIFRHVTLRTLIARAFPMGSPAARLEERVTGGPEWIDGSTFDVEAKAEDPSTTTMDQIQQMLQNLLKTRFQLVFHMDSTTAPGYYLLPVKSGFKLADANAPTADQLLEMRQSGIRFLIAPGLTLAHFADLLTNYVKEPVIDKTDIQGQYDFVLDSVQTGDASGPSIFTALQEEVGLKLEPEKVSLNIFVIDHAEKPAAN